MKPSRIDVGERLVNLGNRAIEILVEQILPQLPSQDAFESVAFIYDEIGWVGEDGHDRDKHPAGSPNCNVGSTLATSKIIRMQEQAEEARVFRDGQLLDVAATVTFRGELRAVPVNTPGQMSRDFKQVPVSGDTTIKFSEPEPELRAELERLLELARDPELRRKNRNWSPRPISITFGDTSLDGCLLSAPFNPFLVPVTEADFVLHHEDLGWG